MGNDAWNPAQYERFKCERSKPFFDLMEMIEPRPNMRVADLGCGTGELTLALHRHLHATETIGIDNSQKMLASAAGFAGDGLRFERQEIEAFSGEAAFDLIFSNAAIHWVPDHEKLLRRLRDALRPGGQLAIQLPDMSKQATHQAATEVAREPEFRALLNGYELVAPTLAPEQYADLLFRLGFVRQNVRLQVYGHLLPTRDEVIEWTRGTMLTAYQSRLNSDDFAKFVERYRERLIEQLPDTRPYFFPFRRILMWASL